MPDTHAHDCATAAAAAIVNLLSSSHDMPKAELFGKVFCIVMFCVRDAHAQQLVMLLEPSPN